MAIITKEDPSGMMEVFSAAAKNPADMLKFFDAVESFVDLFYSALDDLESTEARAEKAERERDIIAEKFAGISDRMNAVYEPRKGFCMACNICPAGSDIEMEGVTCEARLLEWASQQTTCAL